MSFTQENKTNICICDGCEKQCRLWADIYCNGQLYTDYYIYPKIGNRSVDKYVNEFGKVCFAGVKLRNYKFDDDDSMVSFPLPQGAKEAALAKAIHQARLAAKQCPLYQKTK